MAKVSPSPDLSTVPMPSYDDRLWAVMCRPQERMSKFTQSTVLFQPDCRQFCKNGLECKKLRMADANDEAHCEVFLHVPKEQLQAAILLDQECQERAKYATDELHKDPSLPHPPRVLPDPGSTHAGSVEEALVMPHFHNRVVVVFVHGFKPGSYMSVTAKSRLFLRALTEVCQGQRCQPLVVSFMWPARKRVVSYVPAYSNAKRASSRLVHLLSTLRSLNCRVIVVAHSLGARVALGALTMPMEIVRADEVNISLCDHLILCAAALPCDVLAEKGEFPRGCIAAPKITVFYSRHDAVLRASFGLVEAFRVGYKKSLRKGKAQLNNTMGCRGIAQPLPADCACINVSQDIDKHNALHWLLCPDLLQTVKHAMNECFMELGTDAQEVKNLARVAHGPSMDSASWSQIFQGESDAAVVDSEDDLEDDDTFHEALIML